MSTESIITSSDRAGTTFPASQTQCTLSQQQSTSHVLEKGSTLSAGNSTTRRLQTVLVLDKKVQKSLKVREMACADIEAVACSMNVNLQVCA